MADLLRTLAVRTLTPRVEVQPVIAPRLGPAPVPARPLGFELDVAVESPRTDRRSHREGPGTVRPLDGVLSRTRSSDDVASLQVRELTVPRGSPATEGRREAGSRVDGVAPSLTVPGRAPDARVDGRGPADEHGTADHTGDVGFERTLLETSPGMVRQIGRGTATYPDPGRSGPTAGARQPDSATGPREHLPSGVQNGSARPQSGAFDTAPAETAFSTGHTLASGRTSLVEPARGARSVQPGPESGLSASRGQRRRAVAPDSPETAPHPSTRTVHVVINRLEVRTGAPRAASTPKKQGPALTLDEFQRSRRRGGAS